MLKKFSKILLLVLLVLVVSSSSLICLADENHNHTDTVNTTETNDEANTSTEISTVDPEIHNGDLYLMGNEIIMDKLVDGNVFILGNNVEITGKVNGNLFVFANTVNFNDCIIGYSIYTCANSVSYSGSCRYGDLYVAAKNVEFSYNSFVYRDVKSIASDIVFKTAVGRDVDLVCNTLSLGEDQDIPMIYGNLRYTANNEITIPENVLVGDGTATFTNSNSWIDILIGFGICIVTALAVYIILNKLTPGFIQKVCNNNFSIISLLKAFGIGLATIAIVTIFIILLAETRVGITLAIILALLFAILCLIAVPTLSISITNALRPALKIEKTYMFYLVLGLISVILYGVTLIPFIGTVLRFIISVTSIGLIVNIYLPHKELSEEEKASLEEAKKIAKENKEKAKQKKLEAKANQKQEHDKIKAEKKAEKIKVKEAKTKSESKATKKKDKKK